MPPEASRGATASSYINRFRLRKGNSESTVNVDTEIKVIK